MKTWFLCSLIVLLVGFFFFFFALKFSTMEKQQTYKTQDLRIEEPVVEATVLTPVKCLGPITSCLKDRYVLCYSSSFSLIYAHGPSLAPP